MPGTPLLEMIEYNYEPHRNYQCQDVYKRQVLGPHALGLLNNNVLDSGWFDVLESILECTVGLMIGTELIWSLSLIHI